MLVHDGYRFIFCFEPAANEFRSVLAGAVLRKSEERR